MRRDEIREAIALLRLGELGREATEELHEELERSNDAVIALREEERLRDDMRALAARPPVEVDVAARVLEAVAPLSPGHLDEVPRRQLWWTAAAGIAATLIFGVAFWQLLPQTTALARDTWGALASVAGVAGTLIGESLPAAIARVGAPLGALGETAPYLPLLFVGSAIGYAAALSTLAAFLLRDARRVGALARVRRLRRW